jgi:large subunit ribosomal protein L19
LLIQQIFLYLHSQILSKMDAIKFIHDTLTPGKKYPAFKAGDNITVNYKIVEGNKERIQAFKGEVIQIRGSGGTKTFTVRKMSNGVGVERIFPWFSPNVESVELNKKGSVRRARIFYLRDLKGKKARIKEKRIGLDETPAETKAKVAPTTTEA